MHQSDAYTPRREGRSLTSSVFQDRGAAETTGDAAAYCAAQVERYDSDRYATALFAPAALRTDLLGLYAFNLEIAKTREIATQELIGAMRLQWWRDTLDGVFAGNPRRHPVALALSGFVARRAPDRALFDRLIDAREADLDEGQVETMAGLTDYARETSAPLVRLALAVCGVKTDAAHETADRVGTAWALTGLIRSVPFQARRRRTMLPREILAAEGVSADTPFTGNQPGIRAAVRRVAEIAEGELHEARRLRSAVPRAATPALLPATLADGYLRLLRRADSDPFDSRLAMPLPFRSWRLLTAAATGRW